METPNAATADFQTLFNFVYQGLLTQGGPSTTGTPLGREPMCMYRGLGGRKCAIGLLIPDEKYTPEMDNGIGLCGVLDEIGGYTKERLNFFYNMQRAHDRAARTVSLTDRTWEDALTEQMKTVALGYQLDMETNND